MLGMHFMGIRGSPREKEDRTLENSSSTMVQRGPERNHAHRRESDHNAANALCSVLTATARNQTLEQISEVARARTAW